MYYTLIVARIRIGTARIVERQWVGHKWPTHVCSFVLKLTHTQTHIGSGSQFPILDLIHYVYIFPFSIFTLFRE
jgi:hypothetical protein